VGDARSGRHLGGGKAAAYAGWFSTPFLVATGLQGLYVALYGRLFSAVEAVALHDAEE
jgi:hypothetical protein